ncbi:MAG: 16S rRNA (guanine(966)-N(2))-methyltransferase RsmD [Nitrospirae bacterium]|nr:16S rRNA (guanine(966)-N(2))-methyltransferase RsmD [Nitrospirota bacterium]
MIKVTGGFKKGRALCRTPGHHELRPTSGKVKEALFNILGDQIAGADFLDLFAGTGSVGIEALSRGARHCTFVEKDKNHFNLLKKNIDHFQLNASSTLLCLDVFKFKTPGHLYDIAYIDPPYGAILLEKLLPVLGESDMIRKSGLIFVEHFKKVSLSPNFGSFFLKKRYCYGDTHISAYQNDQSLPDKASFL